MPVWMTIVLALGGSTLIGLVVKEIYDMVKNKNKKANQYDKEVEKKITIDIIKEVLREELTPIKVDLNNLQGEVKSIKQDTEVTKGGLQAELRHDIRNSCRRCIQQGFKTEEDISEIEALHEQYEKLGTNGLTNTLYEKFQHLDLKPNDYTKPKVVKSKKSIQVDEK